MCRVWFSAVSLKFPTKFDIISERDMLPFDPQDDLCSNILRRRDACENCLWGAAECKGAPIHYYLLVETLENGVETYGVLVEYLTQRTEVPGITVFRHRAEALLELLRRGRVTPVTVRDVMEDWLLI